MSIVYSGLIGLCAVSMFAAEPAENPKFEEILAKLPKGTEVVNAQPENWKLKNGGPDVGIMSVVDVEGMPFKKAIRMESKKKTDRDYLFQAVTPSTAKVTVSDALMLTFYARAEQVNNDINVSQINMKFFSMKQTGSARNASVAVSKNWQKFYFPMDVFSKQVKEFGPGELTLTLNQGLPPQIVDIADVKLVKYPEGVALKDLPRKVQTYEGRELDAAWRKEAFERIEKIRKSDLSVQVTDEAGKPVTDAQVSVKMKRHLFGFGSAYADPRFFWDDEDSKRYREEFLKLFNVAVSESGMKWEPWLEKREQAIKAAKWVRDHNIPVRGHTLVWCQLDRLPYAKEKPEIMNRYRKDLKGLQEFQLEHIRDEMTALKGVCFEWDLINEAMSHFDYQNLMGMECFLDYFKLAHEIDPDTRLVVNENKLLNSDGGAGNLSFSREEDFYKFLKFLKDNGAPLSGIGIQSHWGGGLTPPPRMLQQLDRFAEFGTISITEFDVAIDDEELQSDITRDFLITCFSHPAINTFVMWGFWDGQHHRRNAPIFRKDWSVKPSGQVFINLVFKQWWTNVDGKTGADGQFKTRGFMGDYEISVTRDGKTVTQPAKLAKDGAVVKVSLK